MVIEKKYYDIAQRELEEMQREINAEKAQMSEEEILEDKKWHDEQLETIIKKAEAHMRCFKKVPDPQKVVKFTFLQKDALHCKKLLFHQNCFVWYFHLCNGLFVLSEHNKL